MNEVQVDLDDVGRIHLSRAGGDEGVYTLETTEALRAFFQAERDKELGRWRDPENPNIVCYPVADYLDAVWVMREGDGSRYLATRTRWERIGPHYVDEAAGRYFQAHPEPKPRPPFAAYVDKNGSAVWVTDENGNLRCLSDQNLDPEKYAPFTRLLPDE